nr:MAG TPA: hypothetical protein [Caudoviricetes sp.]
MIEHPYSRKSVGSLYYIIRLFGIFLTNIVVICYNKQN